MTKIELIKRGQHLVVRNKVKIAEGNINSVQLEVRMYDDKIIWISGTAIFSNDAVENGKTYSAYMMPGEVGDNPDLNYRICTVPHEVLSEDGELSISLEFVEGSTVEKTTIAKMKVHKSLQHDEAVVEPTMNLYLQYLDAIDQLVDPWSVGIRSESIERLNAHTEAMNALIEEQRNFMKGDVLWENPNPSVNFEAQTIALDLSQYERIEIVTYYSTTNTTSTRVTARVGDSMRVYGQHNATATYSRTCEIKSDGIEFGAVDDKVVPFQIYGYKY